MRRIFIPMLTIIVWSAVTPGLHAQENPGTLLGSGQALPSFKAKTIDGQELSSKALRGKKVLILFFNTHCRACRQELRYINEKLGDTRKNKRVLIVAVGRDNSGEELLAFRSAMKLDLAMIADPERQIYKLFAKSQIPRTYLFNKRGELIHQTRNFIREKCDEMLELLAHKGAAPR